MDASVTTRRYLSAILLCALCQQVTTAEVPRLNDPESCDRAASLSGFLMGIRICWRHLTEDQRQQVASSVMLSDEEREALFRAKVALNYREMLEEFWQTDLPLKDSFLSKVDTYADGRTVLLHVLEYDQAGVQEGEKRIVGLMIWWVSSGDNWRIGPLYAIWLDNSH